MRGWRFWLAAVVTVAMGTVAGQASYFVDENTRIVGIPFPAAAFQREDGVWLDFVGPMTGPFMLANAFAWAGLLQVALLAGLRWAQSKGDAVQQ